MRMSPQTFSYTMIGLSTAVLVFFIAYKDDDKPKLEEPSKVEKSNTDDNPSKTDDELPEEYNFDKEEEEPPRMGDSRIGDSRIGDSRIGDSRIGDSRIGGSRSSRSLYKSKHGKNTNTRKKSNKKHK